MTPQPPPQSTQMAQLAESRPSAVRDSFTRLNVADTPRLEHCKMLGRGGVQNSNVLGKCLLHMLVYTLTWTLQDKYTTNVYFPDGTYGNVNSALFNTSEGDRIDLNYGDYTLKDGMKGNIYNGNMSTMKPDTSTLSLPSPWTSSGVGSAIPATGLGTTASLSTGTTIISATTEAPTTGDSITLIATMTGCGNCPPWNTTIAGSSQPGTTRLASTSVFTTGIITPTMVGSKAFRTDTDIAKPVAALVLGLVVFYL